jgi:hypothetical protein
MASPNDGSPANGVTFFRQGIQLIAVAEEDSWLQISL